MNYLILSLLEFSEHNTWISSAHLVQIETPVSPPPGFRRRTHHGHAPVLRRCQPCLPAVFQIAQLSIRAHAHPSSTSLKVA